MIPTNAIFYQKYLLSNQPTPEKQSVQNAYWVKIRKNMTFTRESAVFEMAIENCRILV